MDLLLNAYLPRIDPEDAAKILRAARGPQASGILERATVWLLGCESQEFLRSAWDQQGLLQLYRDFGATSSAEVLEKIGGV
jgi:hypothetical protein